MRWILLLAALAGCRSAQARAESRATLVGSATFVGDPPTTTQGRVRLTVHGTAEDLDDNCRGEGPQAFIASYDGDLALNDDNTFTVPLYPNPIVTAKGCVVTHLRVDRVNSIELEGQLGDELGRGALRFQNLAAVDSDELRDGAFDEIYGDIVFAR